MKKEFIGTAFATALVAISLAWPWPTRAEEGFYRPGQPQTMSPSKSRNNFQDASQVVKKFHAAYVAAGRPKIALFWNVELTDKAEINSVEIENLSIRSASGTTSYSELTDGPAGSGNLERSSHHRTFNMTLRKGKETPPPERRSTTLSERDMWQTETAFTQGLLDAGVTLVDRAAIMRWTSSQSKGGLVKDHQALETSALLNKADFILEVLLTRDPDAPLGWGFRVSLKQVKTGRLIDSIYQSAIAHEGDSTPRYMAVDGDFVLVPESITVQEVGHNLAIETMKGITPRMMALRR